MSDQEPLPSDAALEVRKLDDDWRLRSRELDLQERDIETKSKEQRRSRWANPLVLAVLAAALAGAFNAGVAWMTGRDQLALERTKESQDQKIEELKAESTRILESIKTGDPNKVAGNLKFLIDIGLIANQRTAEAITTYLGKHSADQLPVLPSAAPILRDLESEDTASRREARRELASRGWDAVPYITKILADNRKDPNYRDVVGVIEALALMDRSIRCGAYAKDQDLKHDVERHGGINEKSLNSAAANALSCP
jgi:hypothetical protein